MAIAMHPDANLRLTASQLEQKLLCFGAISFFSNFLTVQVQQMASDMTAVIDVLGTAPLSDPVD
jgi:hypothetical protein